ncbi:MAG: lysophospholipid acyltransferase family protein [Acidobacteriota bacterium]
MRVLLHAVLRLLLRVIFGAAPRQTIGDWPAIVVANHDTHLDVFLVFSLFPLWRVSRVRAVAAADYFGKGFLGVGAKLAFNTILVQRASGDPAAALEPVREALRAKCSLVIFPEGTRGEPGVLMPFKPGIGALAEEFPDVPIYPVALVGAERALPKGDPLPVPFNIEIRQLEKVYGRDLIGRHGAGARRAMAAELEARIREGLKEGGRPSLEAPPEEGT